MREDEEKMMGVRTYEQVGETDIHAVSRLIHHAFGGTLEGSAKWIRDSGIENSRLVRGRAGSSPAASLLRIPMGQFFGGKSVSMLGIAGVTVAPEFRGVGHAKWMMQKLVQEGAADGFALSALYASTQGLYRSVGYEQAGYKFVLKVPVPRIDVHERGMEVRPLVDRDEGAIRSCYHEFAPHFAGMLDRGQYIWGRTRERWQDKFEGFGVFAPGNVLEGYVFLSQSRPTNSSNGEINVSDLVFTTARAGRRLLAFFADFGTMFPNLTLHGCPLHPLLSLMNAHQFTSEKGEVWMVRVLNVKAALEKRGYHTHIKTSLELNIYDELVSENSGAWTMHVEHGRAEVRKESAVRPALACDIRALAPLYCGLYTARQLRLLGWVEGDDAAVDAADCVFGGFGTPSMIDFF